MRWKAPGRRPWSGRPDERCRLTAFRPYRRLMMSSTSPLLRAWPPALPMMISSRGPRGPFLYRPSASRPSTVCGRGRVTAPCGTAGSADEDVALSRHARLRPFLKSKGRFESRLPLFVRLIIVMRARKGRYRDRAARRQYSDATRPARRSTGAQPATGGRAASFEADPPDGRREATPDGNPFAGRTTFG